MRPATFYNTAKNLILTKPLLIVACLMIINFLVRLLIYYYTRLFYFSDYSAYLNGIENIAKGGKQYLLYGNFLFAISYIGFFTKHVLGNIDYFFIMNCLLATLTSLVLYYLIVKVTGLIVAGIITVILHTLYTEFMVFSSVFYTPVLMIFLLSLFILFIYLYLDSKKRSRTIIYLFFLTVIFLLTFFFKPELKYLPWFLLVPGLLFFRKNKIFSRKILLLSFLLFPFSFLLQHSGIITHPKDNVISNSFVFFGHTNYGGDGGEGAFIYPENNVRYVTALTEYCKANNITGPTTSDFNSFQRQEILKFITQHPFKWVWLQFTKFFRTFGVVPESTSFKILYTGLFKENLWLTSVVVVAPVALILLMFILFFNFSSLKQLLKSLDLHQRPSTEHPAPSTQHLTFKNSGFFYIYILLFLYYIIATIFYGQYQERYRMPVMVVFIIPVLAYFITTFDSKGFLRKASLTIKSTLIVLFLTIWIFQAKKAISNKERLENAIESITNK